MEVYQYLFFFNKDMVTVIEYDQQSKKKFSYTTNKGEKKFPITEDFWDWWKDAVCYIADQPTDFFFIYDKEYSILSDSFIKNTEKPIKSCWTESTVRSSLSTMLEHCIGSKIKIDKSNIEFLDNPPKRFYTNMKYNGRSESNSDILTTEDGNRVSPLAEYYRELLISELEKETSDN